MRSNPRLAGLSAKKTRFIEEYVVDLNATQAAIRAGYAEPTAYAAGSRMLKDPIIARAVAARLAELNGRARVLAAKNIERRESRALIAVSDVLDFGRRGSGLPPRLRPKAEILSRARAAIESVREKSRRDQRMLELLRVS